MKKFIITGPTKGVNGQVLISGAKNSCLPLMASSILFEKKILLKNVPFVEDVFTMIKLLRSLGSKIKYSITKKRFRLIITKNISYLCPIILYPQ